MDISRYILYLVLMAGTTYLVRMLPFVVFRNKIESKFINSFLYYMPFAVLAAMTVPEIFFATASPITATVGFVTALVLSCCNLSMIIVALGGSAAVFIAELLIVKTF